MGDPKFPRTKYDTPVHPWKADRITEESAIERKFGLKNKREVWKAKSKLRSIREQARRLSARQRTGQEQAKKETELLLKRLHRVGLLKENATLDDVLALDVERVLTRRLQTQVYLKGYASTPKQARQFISHGHVTIRGIKATVPGHMLTRNEEEALEFVEGSPLADVEHPVRPKPTASGQLPKNKIMDPAPPPEQRMRRRGGR
jgi:small subunit ribosomal protein S4